MRESCIVDVKMNALITRMNKHWNQLLRERERACSLQVLLTGKTSVDHTPQMDMTSHTEGGLVLLQIRGKGVIVF